jgi:hypothetical protein
MNAALPNVKLVLIEPIVAKAYLLILAASLRTSRSIPAKHSLALDLHGLVSLFVEGGAHEMAWQA